MSKARELAALGNAYSDGALSNRNLIINGAMQVAQRGTSVACSASSLTYALDRFAGRPNSSTSTTIAQVTDAPTGFQYSARVTRDSGQTGTLTRFQTGLETSSMVSLRGQKVTISFYAKAGSGYTPSSNALTVNIYEGDGTERIRAITAYDNENTLLQETATLTTSWQRFEYTSSSTAATDLSQLTVEFQAAWSGTAPSNDEYFITGVQLEVGDTATPFEHRSYGQELALCQRYFEKSYSDGVALGTATGAGQFSSPCNNYASGAVLYSGALSYKVAKRVTPTLSFWSYVGTANQWHEGIAGFSEALHAAPSIFNSGTTGFSPYMSSVGAGANIMYGQWAADAEL